MFRLQAAPPEDDTIFLQGIILRSVTIKPFGVGSTGRFLFI